MAISAPSALGNNGSGSTPSSPIVVTIAMSAGESGVAVISFTDNTGAVTGITGAGTWTKKTEITNNGLSAYHTEIWATDAGGASSAASISVAWSGSPTGVVIDAACYPGVIAWGNTATARSGSASQNPTVNLTLQDANNWAICGAGAWDTTSFTYGGSNTFRVRQTAAGASDAILELFDNTQAGTGSITCQALHGSNEWTIVALEARSVGATSRIVRPNVIRPRLFVPGNAR